MDISLVIDLALQALKMVAVMAGPPLLAALVVGLVIGVLQAATQVNESAVAFVPKLIILGLVVLLAGPVTLSLFADYMREMISRIPSLLN
jgi:flagellar biosynthetic protein FliQ